MPASCSGVLPSQRSRLNSPMPRNPTGEQPPPPPHPPRPAPVADAEVRTPRSNCRARAELLRAGCPQRGRSPLAAARCGRHAWTHGRSARRGVRGPGWRRVIERMPRAWGSAPCTSTRSCAPASSCGSGAGPTCSRRPTTRADDWERYRLRTRAILRTRPSIDAASHHAALMLHAVDTFDVDLSVVDVVATVAAARVRSGLRTHPGTGRRPPGSSGFNVVELAARAVPGRRRLRRAPAVCSMDDASTTTRCTRR